jgi:sterol 3beta-glucosyltransferase
MITILCSGSRGDYQPYIALALEIAKLGQAVRMAGGKSFSEFVRAYGIDYYPISADYQSVDLDPQMLKQAKSADNLLKMFVSFNKLKRFVIQMTGEMYAACQGSDLIVYHPGCVIGYFAAENMGIPSILAAPFPMHKTKEFASVIAYGRHKLPNRFSYTLLQNMLWLASKSSTTTFLKQLSNRLPKNFGCPFERVDQRHPAIISCSDFVFHRPSDWNENIYQKGFWFLDEPMEYLPSQELEAFLKHEDKPVYFGFGSVFDPDEKQRFITIIEQALKTCGRRGVVSGMGELNQLQPNILSVGSIPHSWLFKRVSAVCHHGGAGTSASGFRAGVPSIIIPFSNDQFAWACRSFDLGVGAKPLNRKKLSAKDLADAIDYVLSDRIEANARALSLKMMTEDGAGDCAKVIVKSLH